MDEDIVKKPVGKANANARRHHNQINRFLADAFHQIFGAVFWLFEHQDVGGIAVLIV